MTAKHITTIGFGLGDGLEGGSARYIPTLGFGEALPGADSASMDAALFVKIRPEKQFGKYVRSTKHIAGSAFDEIR